jgi:hypothetical protein
MRYVVWLWIALMLAALGIIVRAELSPPVRRSETSAPVGDASNALHSCHTTPKTRIRRRTRWSSTGPSRTTAPFRIPPRSGAISDHPERHRRIHGACGCATPTIRICERIPSRAAGTPKTSKRGFWRFWRRWRLANPREFRTNRLYCMHSHAELRRGSRTRSRLDRRDVSIVA